MSRFANVWGLLYDLYISLRPFGAQTYCTVSPSPRYVAVVLQRLSGWLNSRWPGQVGRDTLRFQLGLPHERTHEAGATAKLYLFYSVLSSCGQRVVNSLDIASKMEPLISK